MSCRLICVALLALTAAARANACDGTVTTAVVVPQTAVVSPLVVLPQVLVPQVVVQSPAHVIVPSVVVPQVKRVGVLKQLRARSVVRTRMVVR